VSGVALAGHKDGHDKGQGPGPKVSIDITNICKLGDGSEGNEVPENILRVTTTVEDVSDDPRNEIDVDTVSVTGQQFVEPVDPPKKKKWIPVGATIDSDETPIDAYTIEFVRDIDICQNPLLQDGAKALNAHVQVMLPDGRNFMRMCDDDESNNVYDDQGNLIYDPALDESRIDLDEFDPPLSCSN
jgi:hypothetical protein